MLGFLAFMKVYNVFHVSLLKKYLSDPKHIIDWTMIQVEHEGDFSVEPVRIQVWKVKVLKNKSIWTVKVQWTRYGPEDATWEHEETMREEY
jgi:hypothetical protein